MTTARTSGFAMIAAAVLVLSPGPFAHAQVGRTRRRSSRDEVPQGLHESDWSSIRGACEASRYDAFEVDGAYLARNPGQRWLTRFDGRGFKVESETDAGTWGLELQRYGFVGEERAVRCPACVSAEGSRVAYDWDATLEEWYVNDARGLEHGYTVHQRPARESCHEEGPLTFTLAVRGGLQADVQEGGRGVHFLNGDGATVLTYTGLNVLDAEGLSLPAHFERATEGLRLTVDARGARYPLTIDPIVQQAYLKASNTNASDFFGYTVSVSGDTAVVGAYLESSSATGVNGNQSDNSAFAAGAAYVFVRSGTSWSQQAYLKASNTGAPDEFGTSVSVSGDTIVVGAPLEGSNATGVNGNETDNSSTGAGAAYVFVRNGTTWSQQAYLKASNTEANDIFGCSVAISGDTIIVGAAQESSNATGVNGNQGNNIARLSGAAYVFVRSGTTWSQQAYLKASNTDSADAFGRPVAISGDTALVAAVLEDSNSTGVNGNQADNSAGASGAAYVFVRSGSSWSQQAYLKASNTAALDQFGVSTSVSGDTVVVGAEGEDSNATGVNGDQTNNSGGGSGAAYVFVRSGTSWSQQAYLKASNTDLNDRFGHAVGVSGDTVVVGAYTEDSNATGMNGNQSDNSAQDSGAVYLFVRSGTSWSQQTYIKGSNTEAHDEFGYSVAVSGDTVVVGADGERSNATGVNGDQTNNSLVGAGAAYAFGPALPETYCTAKTNSSGCTPSISSTGTPSFSAGSGFFVNAEQVLPNKAGLLFYSKTGPGGGPFQGGHLCATAPTKRTPVQTSGTGGSPPCVGTYTIDFNAYIASGIDPGLIAGQQVWSQYWTRDGGVPSGTGLTNGLTFTIFP